MGGEPTTDGEAVPGDGVSTELRLGRSASSIDIARDSRPKPTKPASIGKPDNKPMPCKKNCIDLAKTSGASPRTSPTLSAMSIGELTIFVGLLRDSLSRS